MQYLWMAVIGLVVGVLARWIYPGAIHMGIIASALLGIAGSYVAGLIGQAIHGRTGDGRFKPAGFVYSIIGALLLIFIARRLNLV
jgi:uncharacterized membrane protein YeaQ/YmgE (transglycosylase-associated protein family)